MVDLSPDEKTVLLIAQAGDPMAPIGRWKAPMESLLAKGLLKAYGYFNNIITPAGEAAAIEINKEDDAILGKLIEASAVNHIQQKCRAHAEQIAVQMVDLIELSIQATGASKIDDAKRWSEVIGKRVLEMLR